jgi:pSer/pThr/pTyr-binding forkhead associated (FHA) protein
MNLKSLFQLIRLPRKAGTSSSTQTSKQVVKTFFLEFSDIEASPRYPLESVLTVGSETGDIVIEEPSLAPHHASFNLKDGIVTVQDLGSHTGIRIGEHSLTKGKPVILKADDELTLGELRIALRVVEEEIEIEADEVVETPEEVVETEPEEKIISPQDKLRKRLEQVRSKPRSKIAVVAISGGASRSANMLTRAMGVMFDVFFTVILWQIFSPFDEFRELLAILPQFLQDTVLPLIEAQIAELGYAQDYQYILKEFLDVVSEAEAQLHLSHLVSLFLSWRLMTTLLFGVTVGSWMGGVRAYGNGLWKRVGGVLREILGTVFHPFVIADLPTLFSRRSLQELLTFTHLYSPSKGAVLILWLMSFPILVAMMLVSPIFSGFEMPVPITFNESTNRQKKTKEAEAVTPVVHSSNWFGIRFSLAPESWRVLPRFSWTQKGKSRSLVPSLVFYHQGGTTVPLMLEQTFSWPDLLNLALAHNPPMQSSFPSLWSYAQSSKVKRGSVIQFQPNTQDRLKLQAELQELLKVTFAITPETIVDHALAYGPLFKGPMEFRRAIVSLLKAEEGGNWILGRFGKQTLLVYEAPGVKPFELMVPLVFGEGRVFRVNYASSAEWTKAGRLARTDLWPHSSWELSNDEPVVGAPKVIDVIAQMASGGLWEESQLESIYGFFFESALSLVSLPIEDAHKVALIKSMQNLEEVVGRLKSSKSMEPDKAASLEKLRQKLAEVRGRLELGDASFFAPEPVVVPPVITPPAPVKKKR